ncbi:hypothetical protein [Oricola sp.]
MKMIAAIFGLLIVVIWDTTQNNNDLLRFFVEGLIDFFGYFGF